MKINNEVRRLKAKLALFDDTNLTAFHWVLLDIIDFSGIVLTKERKIELIAQLKEKYKKELEEIEPIITQPKLF